MTEKLRTNERRQSMDRVEFPFVKDSFDGLPAQAGGMPIWMVLFPLYRLPQLQKDERNGGPNMQQEKFASSWLRRKRKNQ